jgi:hypothetical protein
MKKNMGLFFGIVAIVLAALIFSGCPTEASTEKVVSTTKFVAADLDGLGTLLSREGVTTVDYYGELIIGDAALVIPDGKIVNVQDGGVTIANGSLSVIGSGTLILTEGRNITISGIKGVVIGESLASYVADNSRLLNLTDSIDDETFTVKDSVAIASVSGADISEVFSKVTENKTLYVLEDLEINANVSDTTLAGTVKALGNVVLSSSDTVDISNTHLDFSDATLKSDTGTAVTITVNTVAETKEVGAIDAAGSFTLGEGTLTVKGVAKFGGDATFNGGVNFGGDVNFGGGTASLNADSSLADGKTIIVANAAELDVNATLKVDGTIKVESGGTLVESSGSTFSINKSVAVAGGPVFAFGATSGRFEFGSLGKIELENGSTYTGSAGSLIAPNNAIYTWGTGGKVTLLPDNVTDLTSGNIFVAENAGIVKDAAIFIAGGASLTLQPNVTFSVNGTLQVNGNFITDSGNVTVGNTGKIVRPETITWTAVADGTSNTETSTKITFTFSKEVWGLTTSEISVSDGSIGVGTGNLTGKGTTWDLQINVGDKPGSVQVSVSSTKNAPIEGGSKAVAVHVAGEETPQDTDPPENVGGLNAEAISDTEVKLTWINPNDTDRAGIEISWNGQQGDPVSVGPDVVTYTFTGLTYNTSYKFTVKAVDEAGNKSNGIQIDATTKPRPSATLNVKFGGLPTDEAKDITGDKDELSWSAKDVLTVEVDGNFAGYRWYLDDNFLDDKTGSSLTLNAAELDVKTYNLTVFVTTGGVEYAKRLTFTVTE